MQRRRTNGTDSTSPLPVVLAEVAPDEIEVEQRESGWKRLGAALSSTWGTLALIILIAGAGWGAAWTVFARVAAHSSRDDRQDAVLRSVVESGRWQNAALWDVSQGRPISSPPPALPGVE